ncbi:MAG: hypothetical protein QXM92_02880, partial [Candidatus Anstonellales archaeon]
QNMEVLLIDMVGFLFKKKSVGAVREDKKVKEKEEAKKEKKEEGEGVTIATPEEPTTPTTAVVTTPKEPTATPATPITLATALNAVKAATEPTTVVTIPAVVEVSNSNNSNVLHYVVPSTRDFNIEIAENEYIIATGESTIHIDSNNHNNATIVIEVKAKAITRIIVNKH